MVISDVKRLRTKGQDALTRGVYQDAYDFFTQAIDRNLKESLFNSHLYCSRAAALTALGRHLAALADCDTALMLDAKNGEVFVRRAEVRLSLGLYEGAVTDFESALKLRAPSPNVMSFAICIAHRWIVCCVFVSVLCV